MVLRAAPPTVTTRLTGSGSVLVQQYKSRHTRAPESFGTRFFNGKKHVMEENGGWSTTACTGCVTAVVVATDGLAEGREILCACAFNCRSPPVLRLRPHAPSPSRGPSPIY